METPVATTAQFAATDTAKAPLRRGTRLPIGARTALLVTIVVLCLVSLGTSIAVLLMPSRLSLDVRTTPAGGTEIRWLLPGGILWDAGLRQGDQVLLLDGHKPAAGESGSWSGQQITVRQLDGKVLSATVSSAMNMSSTWPLVILSPWFLLFSVLLFLRARPAAAGVASLALFGSTAWALALAPLADSNRLVVGLMAENIAVPLFAACFASFFYVFPRSWTISGRMAAALFTPALLVSALDICGTESADLYPLADEVWSLLLMLYLALGVGLIVRAFLSVRDRSIRGGLWVIVASAAVSVLPFVVCSILPQLLGQPMLLRPEQAILALAVLPVGFAYAILRYDTIDVRLLQRWFVDGFAGAIILCLLAGATVGLCLAAGALPLSGGGLIVVAGLLAFTVAVVFPRVYTPLQAGLDRVLFKDTYDYSASLYQLSHRLSQGARLEALVESLPDRLEGLMNLEFAVLLVRQLDRLQTLAVAGSPPADLATAADAALAHGYEPDRLTYLELSAGPVALAPLETQGSTIGCLCLGPKRSGEPFRHEDQALLLTLSGHVAATIRNAQLTDELRAQIEALDLLNTRLEHAQEAERLRLATEIHDEPLQTALRLQRLIASGEGSKLAANELAMSASLVEELRSICLGIRPSALTELGLTAALELLAEEFDKQSGLLITLDTDPAIAELVLGSEAEVVLYRAAQEAANNASKHAQARAVHVELCCRDAVVELRVTDDGDGFEVPPSLIGLVATGHTGLAGLKLRVERFGGTLELLSQPGHGTTVQVCVPHEGWRS